MAEQTASTHNGLDGKFETFEALKSGMHKLVERATTKPTWFGRMVNTAGETIKLHPIVAVAVVLGVGYAIVRAVRRR